MKKEEDKDLFLLDFHNVQKAKRMFPKGSLDNHLQSENLYLAYETYDCNCFQRYLQDLGHKRGG